MNTKTAPKKRPAKQHPTKAEATAAARKRFGSDWNKKAAVKAKGKKFVVVAKPTKPTNPTGSRGPGPMERVNGAHRPKDGTITVKVWEIADELAKKAKGGENVSRGEVMAACYAIGLKHETIAFQWQRWKMFNGLTGKRTGVKRAMAARKVAKKKTAKKAAKKAPAKKAAKKAVKPKAAKKATKKKAPAKKAAAKKATKKAKPAAKAPKSPAKASKGAPATKAAKKTAKKATGNAKASSRAAKAAAAATGEVAVVTPPAPAGE